MSKKKASAITWSHAIPNLSSKSLSLPHEGLLDCGDFTCDDLSPEEKDIVRKNMEKWFSDLPAELDRIAGAAAETLSREAAGEFERAEAQRVLYLVEKMRGIKSAERSQDVLYGYLLGRRVERMGTLPFESLVVGRQKQLVGLDKHNEKKRKASTELEQKALEAIEQAKLEHPTRAKNIDFLKVQAAKDLGISKSTLNNWLRK